MLRPKRLFGPAIVEIIPTTLLYSYTNKHFSSSSDPYSCLQQQPVNHENENQDAQKRLLLLLHNHQTNTETIQQVHSHSLTNGSLRRETNDKLLLFNALIRSYSLGEFPLRAFLLYKQFVQSYFSDPAQKVPSFDNFTYSFLIKAGANLRQIVLGIQVQGLTVKVGFESDVYVQTALLAMYVVFGNLDDAWKVFVEMPERNSVTWNAMITGLINWGKIELARNLFEEMPSRTVVSWTGLIDGYTRANDFDRAIELFRRMDECDGISPNEVTILAIFPAISGKGDLRMCKSIHGYGGKKGFNSSDIRITNAVIDAYSKCGCIVSASKFFKEISEKRKNIVSWTSIISAFAMHGMGKEAVYHFGKMEKTALKPNRVTFLSVLNACSHGGLVEEGLRFFEKMVIEHDITPDTKHYGCLVDLLGRTGRLEEAEKLAMEIPAETINSVIWRILLGACSFHGNVEMGKRVTQKIMELEKDYGGDYVIMSNIFSGAGRFSDAEKLRRLMDQRNASKIPGRSLV